MLTDGNPFHLSAFVLAMAGGLCFVIYALLLFTDIGAGLARLIRGESDSDGSLTFDSPRAAIMRVGCVVIALSVACLFGPPVILWLTAWLKGWMTAA